MRILLDQGLPRFTAKLLSDWGFDAEHVGDLGMAAATDAAILAAAAERKAVLISLDSDFHALLAASQAVGPSVIRIRVEGLFHEPLARLIAQVISNARQEISAGAVVSVTKQRVRVRRLPIAR